MKVSMDGEDWKKGGGTLGYLKVHGSVSAIQVDCYPLANILAAANVSRLDLLSLDVQGAELDILRTIPWDVIDIQVITAANIL
jgi:FkbM family methyltransferase